MVNKWWSYTIEGWGSFILKEKFKRLKEDIKKWNKEVFGSMDLKIEEKKKEIQKLDIIDGVFLSQGVRDYEKKQVESFVVLWHQTQG